MRDTQLQRKNYSSSTGFQSLLTCNEVLARIVKTVVSGHECGEKRERKRGEWGRFRLILIGRQKKANWKLRGDDEIIIFAFDI